MIMIHIPPWVLTDTLGFDFIKVKKPTKHLKRAMPLFLAQSSD
jgi:hypothetical protein